MSFLHPNRHERRARQAAAKRAVRKAEMSHSPILGSDGQPIGAPPRVAVPGEVPVRFRPVLHPQGGVILLISVNGQAELPVPIPDEGARAFGVEMISLAALSAAMKRSGTVEAAAPTG